MVLFQAVIYSSRLRSWVSSLTRLPNGEDRSSGQAGDKLIADIKQVEAGLSSFKNDGCDLCCGDQTKPKSDSGLKPTNEIGSLCVLHEVCEHVHEDER